ncbi:hypothetical protein C818_03729 [Lachnospiraceae bacterium MD308]|nr:hypothetical protein C818_03729 [Lachnospiraceae bacterium MD308]
MAMKTKKKQRLTNLAKKKEMVKITKRNREPKKKVMIFVETDILRKDKVQKSIYKKNHKNSYSQCDLEHTGCMNFIHISHYLYSCIFL